MSDIPAGLRDTLVAGFLASAARVPDRPAVKVGIDGDPLTYAALLDRATRIAVLLARHDDRSAEPPLTAVLARRSLTASAGMLGALLRGHGYVPLNATFPAARTVNMLQRSGCRAIIVDEAGEHGLDDLLPSLDPGRVVLLEVAPAERVRELAARHPDHTVLGADDLAAVDPSDWTPPDVAPDAIAYLLFTSGSTGQPKGVMVAHPNIRHFVRVMVDRYGLRESDRFSQTFELVFDLSMFDHYCAWEAGACVCVPTDLELKLPARYVAAEKLTVWFSVPSLGLVMKRLRMLKAGFYPDLRWVLFCGEALPVGVARAFADAAPNAYVENLYGPTEVTLACTLHRWDPGADESDDDLVPIGDAYPGLTARIVDDTLHEVADGTPGELLLTGPQVCPGYWGDPERTARAFTAIPGHDAIHYRTGDRVVRPRPDAPIRFLGRVDHQVKIRGHRVELGEIEAAAREVGPLDVAVAIPWPESPSGPEGVVLCTDQPVSPGLTEALSARLPDYMVPSDIHVLDELPLNANGKIDRPALKTWLSER